MEADTVLTLLARHLAEPYVEQGCGLDPEAARAAEVQGQAWRERRELWLPRSPQEPIAELENTQEYPPDGSATGPGGGRQ